MKNVKELSASKRKDDFFKSLNLSETTTNNYRSALHSSFLVGILNDEYNTLDPFEIVDVKVLWCLYDQINSHPKNIRNHRAYSAAIMKYIRYLNNGQRIGKRNNSGCYKKDGPRVDEDLD